MPTHRGNALAITIRPIRPADRVRVGEIITEAFGQPDEMELVSALRDDVDAEIEQVALVSGDVVGHVLMSKMISPEGALGLAPVSVTTNAQSRGVGAALIRAALDAARSAGWSSAFVLGDLAYYSKFGFSTALAEPFASPYSGPHFGAMELSPGALNAGGCAAYAPAFSRFE